MTGYLLRFRMPCSSLLSNEQQWSKLFKVELNEPCMQDKMTTRAIVMEVSLLPLRAWWALLLHSNS